MDLHVSHTLKRTGMNVTPRGWIQSYLLWSDRCCGSCVQQDLNDTSIHLLVHIDQVMEEYHQCIMCMQRGGCKFICRRIKKDESRGTCFFCYEQQVKWELKRIHVSGYRCNERLKSKTDGSKRLTYTGLCGDLEHLTIETRLISESFECVMGECVI